MLYTTQLVVHILGKGNKLIGIVIIKTPLQEAEDRPSPVSISLILDNISSYYLLFIHILNIIMFM